MTRLSLSANVTHLVYERAFRVHGMIDSSMSKADINNYKVVLREYQRKVDPYGRVSGYSQDYDLYDGNKSLYKGQNE